MKIKLDKRFKGYYLGISIIQKGAIMTKEEAVNKLIEEKDLSTSMLEPLGIGFETFLRWACLRDAVRAEVIDKLIIVVKKRREA